MVRLQEWGQVLLCKGSFVLKDPLPKSTKIGVLRCKMYHVSQKKAERQCKVCRQQGHKELTEECPYYEPDYRDCTIAFRSPSIFSNFYHCEINFQGKLHRSVEHAYQYTKAQVSGYDKTAKKIYMAKTAKDAKLISKDIPESEAWDIIKLDIMTELIKIKMDPCEAFCNALMETGNKLLVEATGDLFFATGLSPEATINTRPGIYPGLNEMGKIMMELRSACQLSSELASKNLMASSNSPLNEQDISQNKSVFLYKESQCPAVESQQVISTAKQEDDAIKATPVTGTDTQRLHRNDRKVTATIRSSSVPAKKDQGAENCKFNK